MRDLLAGHTTAHWLEEEDHGAFTALYAAWPRLRDNEKALSYREHSPTAARGLGAAVLRRPHGCSNRLGHGDQHRRCQEPHHAGNIGGAGGTEPQLNNSASEHNRQPVPAVTQGPDVGWPSGRVGVSYQLCK